MVLPIVAIAWLYVTLLMALAERSFVAGVATFLLYGLLPLSIALYLLATPARRKARARLERDAQATAGTADDARSGGASAGAASDAGGAPAEAASGRAAAGGAAAGKAHAARGEAGPDR